MSADGTWKITLNTPMGPQQATVVINTSGAAFTGRIESAMGSQDIAGSVAGDTLTWSAEITQPMPLKIDFEAQVAGDNMTGRAQLGMFGAANFSGARA